jgi:hypothetical protein
MTILLNLLVIAVLLVLLAGVAFEIMMAQIPDDD